MKYSPGVFCLTVAWILALAAGRRQGVRSPVEKVVNLLKDLKTKIEEDGKVEGQTFDRYACWCEKTTARKASDITTARDDLRKLGQTILQTKGQVATLMSEIQQLQQDIKANEEAQAEATSIRQKENAAYMAESAEMKEVLAALEKAILVLREGTKPSSFLQQGSTASNAVRAVVEALPASAARAKLGRPALLGELAKLREGGAYAPQSATIQGILTDMYDTFSTDLESAIAEEGTRNRNFETLIDDKTKQLMAFQDEMAKKEQTKAEAEQMLADSTQSYDDTESQMKADIVFFDETKAACESKHTEWVTRSDLRKEELDGITQALAILTTDSARQLFATAIKPGKETGMDDKYDTGVGKLVFFQVATEGAYAPLRDAARRAGSLRLANLAVHVREAKVGHFDVVIKEIDTMIQTLKDEGLEDIAKRDQCLSEYQKINSTVANVEWMIKKNNAKIDKLTTLIQELKDERTKTLDEIKAITDEIAAMKKQRQDENAAFLQAKKDDQDAIKLLASARTALTSYYTNHSIELGPVQGMLLAQQGPDFNVSQDQAPEATFSGKGKRKLESKGIVQLLTMIMEDLNDEIKNDMKAEEIAQIDYEKQLLAANTLKDELTNKEVNLADRISKRTLDKGDEDAALSANEKDLKAEEDYRKQITPDCDWIIGAFEKRAAQRAAEMSGLTDAKEYLAGYSPSTLLEKKQKVVGGAARVGIHAHGGGQ